MAQDAYLSGEILPGTVYRIVRPMGEEGTGPVYEVEDSTVGRRYALKIIRDPNADVRELSERLMRESRILAQIADPRVVGVYTGGVSTDGRCFTVMEIPEGEPLSAVLRRQGKLELGSIFSVAIEVSETLANIHAVGIVHRDVKPENIFIPRGPQGGSTKLLLDLGVATPFEGATAGSATPHGATEHGTYGYASPEQLRREPASPLMDIWSLGCVLFEAISGRLPFEVSSDWRTFVDGVLGPSPAPRLSLVSPEAPAELVALLARMLRKEPSRRLPRAEMVAESLRRVERRRSSRPPAPAPADGGPIEPTVGHASTPPRADSAATQQTLPDALPRTRTSSEHESVTLTIPQAFANATAPEDESITKTIPQASAAAATAPEDESITKTIPQAFASAAAPEDESVTKTIPQAFASAAAPEDESVTLMIPQAVAPSGGGEWVARTMAQRPGGGLPMPQERRATAGRVDSGGVASAGAIESSPVAAGTDAIESSPVAAGTGVVESSPATAGTGAIRSNLAAASRGAIESSPIAAGAGAIGSSPVGASTDVASSSAVPSHHAVRLRADASLALMPPQSTRAAPAANVVGDDRPSPARLVPVPQKPRLDRPSTESMPGLSTPPGARRVAQPPGSDPASHRALRRTYTLLFLSVIVAWMTVALVFLCVTRSRRQTHPE